MWLISFKDNSDKRYYYMIETINLCVCYLRMGNTGNNQPISSFLSVIRQYIVYAYYRKKKTLYLHDLSKQVEKRVCGVFSALFHIQCK